MSRPCDDWHAFVVDRSTDVDETKTNHGQSEWATREYQVSRASLDEFRFVYAVMRANMAEQAFDAAAKSRDLSSGNRRTGDRHLVIGQWHFFSHFAKAVLLPSVSGVILVGKPKLIATVRRHHFEENAVAVLRQQV